MKMNEQHQRLPPPPIDLIVCSSSGKWTAALRTAMADAIAKWSQFVIRLQEVEDFGQLDAALCEESWAVVGVELGEENLRSFLDWAANRRSDAPVVGLLSIPPTPWDEHAAERRRERCTALAALVREAGAVWTLDSPLEVLELLEIAARYGQTLTSRPATAPALDTAIWRTLPWQSNRAPLRLTRDI